MQLITLQLTYLKIFIMKKLFLSAALQAIGFLNAQVKIGNNPTSLNTTSLLELESTTQGFLLPIMNNDQIS
jgi:glutaminase